jgi:hypothetical protein
MFNTEDNLLTRTVGLLFKHAHVYIYINNFISHFNVVTVRERKMTDLEISRNISFQRLHDHDDFFSFENKYYSFL